MSKICICSIVSLGGYDRTVLKDEILQIVRRNHCAAFFTISPGICLFEQYSGGEFVFSLADDWRYDNCEKLLLADNAQLNGLPNDSGIIDRLQGMFEIADHITDLGLQLHLFLGIAYTGYDEFVVRELSNSQLPRFILRHYRTWQQQAEADYHLIISGV